MEYIDKIRRAIGADRVLIPATAIVILNENEQVLLHVRGESGEWGLPGGLMDIGETVQESAARETLEETGLSVTDLNVYGIFSGPEQQVNYPNGNKTAPVVIAFFTKKYTGSLTKSEESPDLQFFSLSRLPQPMNRYHLKFVENFLIFRQSGKIVF